MKRILRNSIWLIVGEGIWNLLLFLLLVAAAREFGVFAYGQFSYAYAIAAIIGILASFGFPLVLTRELVQTRNEKTFSTLLFFEMIFGACALTVLGGVAALVLWKSSAVVSTFLLLLVFFWASAMYRFIVAFFRARQRMEYEAISRIGAALLLFVVGMSILKLAPRVELLAAGYAGAGVVATVCILLIFHLRVHTIRFSVDREAWKAFFKLSWPVGLVVVFLSILGNTGSVMLGLFGQLAETGWYSAGYRIAGLAVIPAMLIGTSFYPVLSEYAVSSKEQLRVAFRRYIKVAVSLGILLSIIGFLSGSFLVNALYGEEFAPASLALRFLWGMVLLQFLYLPFHFLLLAAKQVRMLMMIMGGGVGMIVLLNIVLIPSLSLYGSAIASVVTYAVMTLTAGVFSIKKIL
jgi:O-antigen/teichoic acid export membrane protein